MSDGAEAMIQQAASRLKDGDAAGAERFYRAALEIDPDALDAAGGLGMALFFQQKHQESLTWLYESVSEPGARPREHMAYMRALVQCGRVNEAVAHGFLVEKELTDSPSSAAVLIEWAQHLLAVKRDDEAFAAARRAVAMDPSNVAGFITLSAALSELRRWDEAVGPLRRASEFAPDNALVWANLGGALAEAGEIDKAKEACNRALSICDALPVAWHNLAIAHLLTGDYARMTELARRAVDLDPDFTPARSSVAMELLRRGDYRQGFKLYADRHGKSANVQQRKVAGRQWDGTPMPGRRLLVLDEQGFGDFIQFARFLPAAGERVGGLTIECRQPLVELVRSSIPGCKIILRSDPTPAFDVHVPYGNLPHVLGTTLHTLPNCPYLFASLSRAEAWKKRLSGTGLKVGIVWTGSNTDVRRAAALSTWAPIGAVSGVSFFSLQKGPAAAQIASAAFAVEDLSGALSDFADTAAAIMAMDLVISVDTAVAHLAGALGRPVWVLLQFVSDWRWLTGREDSPWYPSARLFRQATAGDWAGVFNRVSTELRTWAVR